MSIHIFQTVLAADNTAQPLTTENIPCAQVYIQPLIAYGQNGHSGNSTAIYLGDKTVAVGFGIALVPQMVPFEPPYYHQKTKGGDGLNLSDLYIAGTKGDGVNVLYETY
jgi:hypothetical protein